ncbi:TetR/AcrR family transcriptional regulator [Antrihabitans sp. YC2-6]|uniref:TetR/AcrR family transcriptional regulator n=1 Tax=Antrihabitans sp. YC2-6 TaxID=2799498 RepID=UPI0018F681F1|nr:TetR/AcrR family transcriptional regulator [Antrihabitans sp. YC2-6]MBJ8346418.1 TetR/AcrR family transcriptional regulator [Antrihabitans sp. YC2-6]
MPKVTEAHRVARRSQIIDAARRRFASNGFHMTSMDDVIAETGLSAGALYGYFPGKDALILATIDETLDILLERARTVFDESATHPTIGDTIEQLLTTILGTLAQQGSDDVTRIALYAWAEAPRNPAVHKALTTRYTQLRATFAEIAGAWLVRNGSTPDPATTAAIAKTLLSTIMGFVTQRILLGDIHPHDIRVGLDALSP